MLSINFRSASIILSFLLSAQILYCQESDIINNLTINREKTINWIKENAIRLKSVKAGTDPEDLKSFKRILSDVRIVGLGEATHGTKEFFTMKHKMIEFLVKNCGFRILAMEFNYAGTENINNYILYGNGDALSSLASQGLMVWDTEEILNLVE